jgi:hypothetical protein
METKLCTKCNLERPITDFRKDQYNRNGYHPHCRSCYNESQRKYRSKNKEKLNKTASEYYAQNSERIQTMRKLRRGGKTTNHLHSEKSSSIQSKNGWQRIVERKWKANGILDMTYQRYETMLESQNYSCSICSKKHTDDKKLHVDHCHTTGKVRGLLCNNCNNGIGKLKDSTELLEKAINYLKTYSHEHD